MVEGPGVGHAELFTLYPGRFCRRLTGFFLQERVNKESIISPMVDNWDIIHLV